MSDASYLTTHVGADDAQAPALPFVYTDERQIFNSLHREFADEVKRVDERRVARKHRVNVEELRNDPNSPILADETVIADRTIDRNVRQQSAPYIQFLTQSPTVLSFYDIELPDVNFDAFSAYVSDIFRMGEWQKPWLLTTDALQVHGGAWFELIYTPELAQQAEIEYIRRENLIIPMRARSVDACDRFAREYELTKRSFKALAKKHGFNPAVVAQIEEQYKHKSDFIRIYKWFMRDENGVFHNAWMSGQDVNAELWLKDPQLHQLGIFDVSIDALGKATVTPKPTLESPVFFVPLYAEEDETLLGIQGRAALDISTQEAVTAVVSATVNGATRAAGFYLWDQGNGRGSEPVGNKAPIQIQHGHVVKGNIGTFQPAWPNAIALSVVQQLSTRNSQESGQVDFAAMTRQDTAKRATEITAAKEQATELSSVSMLLFSISIKPAFILWLRIIASAVQLGRIKVPPQYVPLFARVGEPALNITMSADITVVRRAQRALKYLQNYALVAGTPYADPYYKTMLSELFPEEFPLWSRAVGETDRFKQALAQFVQLLPQIPNNAVPDELKQPLAQLLDGSAALLNPELTAPDGTPT